MPARSVTPAPPSSQPRDTPQGTPSVLQLDMTALTAASVSSVKRLSATTGGRPKRRTFSTCLARFSSPCIASARVVATMTAADGTRPPVRHLMSTNFSAPRSLAKPASVTRISPSLSPSRVAIRLLQPCAMLPKGPPCTSAGVPSSVWTMLGLMASFMRTAIAPAARSSRAVTSVPSPFSATTTRSTRALKSCRSRARHRIAMISDATVMSKPPVGQADRGGGFTLARRGRRHRRHEHERAVGPAADSVDHLPADLRLVASVGLEVSAVQSERLADRLDRLELHGAGDVDVLFSRYEVLMWAASAESRSRRGATPGESGG